MKQGGYRIWWIAGLLAGLVAIALHHQIIEINIQPLASEEGDTSRANHLLNQLMQQFPPQGGPLQVAVESDTPLEGRASMWTAKLEKGGNTFPVVVLDEGRVVVLGQVFQMKDGSYQVMKPVGHENAKAAPQTPPTPQEINYSEIRQDPKDLVTSAPGAPTLVEFASLRCGACIKLEPVIKEVVNSRPVDYYAKIIVPATDRQAQQAWAVLERLREKGSPAYFEIRQLLSRLLGSGQPMEEFTKTLGFLGASSKDPAVQEALTTEVTPADLEGMERIRLEMNKANVAFTPTYIAQGVNVRPRDMAMLKESLNEALDRKEWVTPVQEPPQGIALPEQSRTGNPAAGEEQR